MHYAQVVRVHEHKTDGLRRGFLNHAMKDLEINRAPVFIGARTPRGGSNLTYAAVLEPCQH